jgi:hypothetical protein
MWQSSIDNSAMILVLGQFIGDQEPSVRLILGGAAGWLILNAVGLVLLGGSHDADG